MEQKDDEKNEKHETEIEDQKNVDTINLEASSDSHNLSHTQDNVTCKLKAINKSIATIFILFQVIKQHPGLRIKQSKKRSNNKINIQLKYILVMLAILAGSCSARVSEEKQSQ